MDVGVVIRVGGCSTRAGDVVGFPAQCFSVFELPRLAWFKICCLACLVNHKTKLL
jgi:hypothetical protein